MNTAQIQNLIIKNSQGLSKELLQEVLDFIQFLKLKKSGAANNSLQASLTDLNASELTHLEEEFNDYKDMYPRE